MKSVRKNLIGWAVSAFSTMLIVCNLAVPALGAQAVFNDACNEPGTNGVANTSPVCQTNGSNNISGPNGIIIKVANIFAFVAGIGAVFVILIGGFMYVTAAGDANKASSGRSAVIYASVGLVVIVLGRAIIGFVITKF